MTLNRFFGHFAGDALARERATPAPSIQHAPKGTAHCEGCARRKPIVGASRKGWRCGDCKQQKNGATNR